VARVQTVDTCIILRRVIRKFVCTHSSTRTEYSRKCWVRPYCTKFSTYYTCSTTIDLLNLIKNIN
jgi:hypothetical protein